MIKTRVVDATTIYNVPLSEYPLVLDCRSREKYKQMHVKISWNVVPEEGVDRVISEAFDEDAGTRTDRPRPSGEEPGPGSTRPFWRGPSPRSNRCPGSAST